MPQSLEVKEVVFVGIAGGVLMLLKEGLPFIRGEANQDEGPGDFTSDAFEGLFKTLHDKANVILRFKRRFRAGVRDDLVQLCVDVDTLRKRIETDIIQQIKKARREKRRARWRKPISKARRILNRLSRVLSKRRLVNSPSLETEGESFKEYTDKVLENLDRLLQDTDILIDNARRQFPELHGILK